MQYTSQSNKGYSGWSTRAKKALLVLASPDPASPIAEIPDELKYMINLNSGVKIAIFIKQDLPEGCNWKVDAAMCGNYAKGSLGMNELVIPGRKCEGINVFSCGIDCPFETGDTNANLIDRIEAKLDNNLTCLTSEEIIKMTHQNFSLPTDYLQLCAFFENNIVALSKFYGDDSFIKVHSEKFYTSVKKLSTKVDMYTKQYQGAFYYSLLERYHLFQADLVNKALREPENVTKEDFDLKPVVSSIKNSTFWNIYASPGVTKSVADYTNKSTDKPSEDKPTVVGNGWESRNAENRKNKNKKRSTNPNSSKNEEYAKSAKVLNSNTETNSTFRMGDLHLAMMAIEEKPPKISGNDICCRWFYSGHCRSVCTRSATHVKATGNDVVNIKNYRKVLETKAKAMKSE